MTDHATLYREAAWALGAWTALLRPPKGTTMNAAAAKILSAHALDVPLNAAIHPAAQDATLATLVVLTRHPSVTRGTPTANLCASEARYVAALLGWQLLPPAPRQLVVPMGLREGYDADSPVAAPETVAERLSGRGARCPAPAAAQLISAWWADGRRCTYTEPGVVITSNHPGDLDAITAVADSLGQQQIVVTDFAEDRTYALHQIGE